jgi:hypothetical protein
MSVEMSSEAPFSSSFFSYYVQRKAKLLPTGESVSGK